MLTAILPSRTRAAPWFRPSQHAPSRTAAPLFRPSRASGQPHPRPVVSAQPACAQPLPPAVSAQPHPASRTPPRGFGPACIRPAAPRPVVSAQPASGQPPLAHRHGARLRRSASTAEFHDRGRFRQPPAAAPARSHAASLIHGLVRHRMARPGPRAVGPRAESGMIRFCVKFPANRAGKLTQYRIMRPFVAHDGPDGRRRDGPDGARQCVRWVAARRS